MPEHPIRRRPLQPVKVQLSTWQPEHRQDQLNSIRSELELEGFPVNDTPEFDDGAR